MRKREKMQRTEKEIEEKKDAGKEKKEPSS